MQYAVISLERTPHRLQAFQERNREHSRIKWFKAVDGRRLSYEGLEQHRVIAPGFRGYSLASVGCALSHMMLWVQAIGSGEPITIFEDDALLSSRFFDIAEKMAAARGEYDFIQWGWNFDSILSFHLPGDISLCTAYFSQDEMRRQSAVFPRMESEHRLYRLHSSFGLMAYTVSPAGASKLMTRCFPLRQENTWFGGLGRHVSNYGIDIVMNEVYRQPDAQCFTCFPPLALSRNEHDASTIRGDS